MKQRTGLQAGTVTVYGVQDCSWTQKQLNYLNDKDIAYTYVDCERTACPSSVKGYPTLRVNGKTKVGYQEI